MKILTYVDLTIWWLQKIAKSISCNSPFWLCWGKCGWFFYVFSYCSAAGEETWDLSGLDEGRRKQKLVPILRGLWVFLRVRAEGGRVGNKQVKQKRILSSFLGVHVLLFFFVWVQKFKIKKEPELWLRNRSPLGGERAGCLISTPVFIQLLLPNQRKVGICSGVEVM